MFKITPNPPETDPISGDESPDAKKFNEAVDRALSHYLGPTPNPDIMATPYQPSTMFTANPKTKTEELLVNASESLGSASVMLGDVIGLVRGPARKTLQGIAQVVMLGELAVNQALDNVVPVE
ncbi:hypothetical protein PS896_04070 [Pseudomonas fluorescens]|jgi:hypothetical protein|uniref:Uncharacterized protein n=1 Tax=Pseudomonas fluorescens TaxID=294 RepID=A0A5E7MLJ5_PSEFL|nr:hypothetical protein [Pseudomonas fluorescens]MCP1487859.1 hypothetical protein [Pseudomonas fluorescens]VVP25499.1 hypothetical protein PS896_04070 [Pseudomonas fluorescens]